METWPVGLALAWQQGAVSPCVAKMRIVSGIPFSLRKTPLVFPAPCLVSMGQGFSGLHVCWGREIQWELKSFGKRAVVERVLRETKQLPVCGWKILLGVGE